MLWTPPALFSPAEARLTKRLKKAGRFYLFLRTIRDRLFDLDTQHKLAGMYAETPHGVPPKPPAFVAMVLLLQAYAKVSDEEAIRRVFMDKAWQMVLGVLELDDDAFTLAQGTVFNVRERLLATGMDKVLLARTVTLARETGLFGARALAGLRLAVDSTPLEGAGRVEDTLNLLGHALRHVVEAAARVMARDAAEVAREAGVSALDGPSVKAALDQDWNDPEAVRRGLTTVLAWRATLDAWMEHQPEAVRWHTTVRDAQALVARLVEQDTEGDPTRGGRQIKEGVAEDRVISLHDLEMRHGRKSASQRIDGYKRYVGTDLDAGVVMGVAVQPANVGEHHGADALRPEVEAHGRIDEVHVDRAFLASELVADIDARGGTVVAKPLPNQGTPGFTKADFAIDLEAQTVTCPAGKQVPIQGEKARFPHDECAACPHRPKCQPKGIKSGRTIHVHPREALLKKLRAEVTTPEGRATRRERVAIEHEQAHLVHWQGDRARYFGTRKNEYDLRRAGALLNLHAIQHKIGIHYELEEAA